MAELQRRRSFPAVSGQVADEVHVAECVPKFRQQTGLVGNMQSDVFVHAKP